MFDKIKLKILLNKYLQKSHYLKLLIDTFELNNYSYGIVGGFVRDCLLNNDIRDIDIIVDVKFEEILYLLNKYNIKYKHNTFKGLKIYDKNADIIIDLWSLSDHRPFTQGYFEKSWKNIPRSNYTNDGGCVWLPIENKLYLGKTKQLIKNKIVDFYDLHFFQINNIDNKHITATKLLNYYTNDRFKLSKSCIIFLKKYLSKQRHVTSVKRFAKENGYDIDINDFMKRS